MPETTKLLGSTKSRITKNEITENVLNLEITKVVLVHCNIVNNSYQQNSRVLYAFFQNKSFGQLLDLLPKSFISLKTCNSEFSHVKVLFTDQAFKLLERKDKINITSVIH